MKYFGLTLNLKDDPSLITKYKEYHRQLWPEVEASLRRARLRKMRLFLLGRRLFMYMEVEDDFDLATYLASYMEEPKAVEWEKLMKEFQEPLPEAKPWEWWGFMDPIYEFN